MNARSNRLPRSVPVGTKYVIEGRGGGDGRLLVSSRYVEFPDGRHLQLHGSSGHSRRSARTAHTIKKF
jgi:hypothetical protein